MNQTSNYQLNQWDPEDRILRTDFNEDNAKLDAALKANASAISSEASTRSSAVNTLTNKLNKKGNCRVEIMTYVGTGHQRVRKSQQPDFLRPAGAVLYRRRRGRCGL